MTLFTRRQQATPSQPAGINSLDESQRIGLWNALDTSLFSWWQGGLRGGHNPHNPAACYIENGCNRVWAEIFNKALDLRPEFKPYGNRYRDRRYLSDILYDQLLGAPSPDAMGIIEIFIQEVKDSTLKGQVIEAVNSGLERTGSVYRFSLTKFIQVTSERQLEEIKMAASSVDVVGNHLMSAEKHFAEGEYRQSVKESISAVEAKARILTGTTATLGAALKLLVFTHKAFHDALDKLFGFTSDSSGVRHSLLEKKAVVSEAEARFFLVVCSAFINYMDTAQRKPSP